MKTVKVDHVILTLALSPHALTLGGQTREDINQMINARLAEGYDEVEVIPLRTNMGEREQATHVINQYIFRKFERPVESAKSKNA